jgi:hypothetical protein
MKHKLLIFTLLILTNFAFGQMEQLIGLRNLYSKTDSLSKLKKPFVITEEFKSTLIDLDKGHPAKFFEKFNEYLNKDKFDECSFLYHLGVLRYRYYNATNKDYQASGDGALFSSLKYMTGEIISIYLKNDIDKYIEILNSVDNYCENNDYTFHSKFINIEKYNELKFVDLIKNLSENKNTFSEEWSKERKEMKDNLDKAVEEFNKMSEEDKKKLNKN